MGQRLDLNKKQIIEVHGNDMVLTLTVEGHNEIHARIESAEGGRAISVKQHPEDGQTMIFYLKDAQPHFRLV